MPAKVKSVWKQGGNKIDKDYGLGVSLRAALYAHTTQALGAGRYPLQSLTKRGNKIELSSRTIVDIFWRRPL